MTTAAPETVQPSPLSRRRLGIGGAVGGSVLIAALVLGAVPANGGNSNASRRPSRT